jgi:hypothetical protein
MKRTILIYKNVISLEKKMHELLSTSAVNQLMLANNVIKLFTSPSSPKKGRGGGTMWKFADMPIDSESSSIIKWN